jgi:hypothetical protein
VRLTESPKFACGKLSVASRNSCIPGIGHQASDPGRQTPEVPVGTWLLLLDWRT